MVKEAACQTPVLGCVCVNDQVIQISIIVRDTRQHRIKSTYLWKVAGAFLIARANTLYWRESSGVTNAEIFTSHDLTIGCLANDASWHILTISAAWFIPDLIMLLSIFKQPNAIDIWVVVAPLSQIDGVFPKECVVTESHKDCILKGLNGTREWNDYHNWNSQSQKESTDLPPRCISCPEFHEAFAIPVW